MKRKILITILTVAVLATLGIASVTTAASAYDTTIEEWGEEYFNKLDYGLYWYTEKDNPIPSKDYEIDPNKPTLIYTHGWKPLEESKVREGLSLKPRTSNALDKQGFSAYPYDIEFYNYYLDKGYNIGVFYWNQLADDGMTYDVITKVWHSGNGKNMRYVTYADENAKGVLTSANDPTNPKESLAVLYGNAIKEKLGKDFNGSLQLVGHSMGGELTCAVAEYLCLMYDNNEIGENLLPDRVTMLDPFLPDIKVNGKVDHTGEVVKNKTVAELTAEATETIHAHGIPIEAYGTNIDMCFRYYGSPMVYLGFPAGPERDACYAKINELNEKFAKNCVWVYLEAMGLYGGFSPTHVMTIDYYYTTNNFGKIYTSDGTPVPTAKLETEELKKMIGMAFIQKCDNGKNPFYANQSTFLRCDFKKLKSVADSTPLGRIYGNVSYDASKIDEAVAKLYDESGKEIDAFTMDASGDYYFDYLEDGAYTVKIFINGVEREEEVSVSVSEQKIFKAEGISIATGNDVMFIIMIAVVALFVVVCLTIIIAAFARRAKYKKINREYK